MWGIDFALYVAVGLCVVTTLIFGGWFIARAYFDQRELRRSDERLSVGRALLGSDMASMGTGSLERYAPGNRDGDPSPLRDQRLREALPETQRQLLGELPSTVGRLDRNLSEQQRSGMQIDGEAEKLRDLLKELLGNLQAMKRLDAERRDQQAVLGDLSDSEIAGDPDLIYVRDRVNAGREKIERCSDAIRVQLELLEHLSHDNERRARVAGAAIEAARMRAQDSLE